MRIIFFGSSRFAVPSLRALKGAGHQILCVVTQPDRKKGRHLHVEPTAVNETARAFGLEVYQPQSVNLPESIEYLEGMKPELFIVIAYGQILSPDLLSVPAQGALNAHASLLPRYRGAAPINWAIINREKRTGVSIIRMNERMDAGPIMLQQEYAIREDETALSLESALSELTPPVLLEALRALRSGAAVFRVQNRQKVSYAPKLKKNDGLIDWSRGAEELTALIRGCLGWPGAHTCFRGRLLKIFSACPQSMTLGLGPGRAGEVLGAVSRQICVATGKGILAIQELQLEGGKRLPAHEFLIGHALKNGEILGGELKSVES